MSRVKSLLLVLAVLPSRSTDAVDPINQGSSVHRISIRSGPKLSPEEAAREATQKVHECVLERLSGILGESMSEAELRRSIPNLLTANGLHREEQPVTLVKPYGLTYRHQIDLAMPHGVVRDWVDQMQQRREHWKKHATMMGGITVGIWLCVLVTMRRLDRLTRGYQRRPILVNGGLIMVVVGLVGLVLALV